MTTTQINTRAAIIRSAIISASDRDDLVPSYFTCLVDRHGIEAMTEAGFSSVEEFTALVELCVIAMEDAKAA
jgi:hypothetical protein